MFSDGECIILSTQLMAYTTDVHGSVAHVLHFEPAVVKAPLLCATRPWLISRWSQFALPWFPQVPFKDQPTWEDEQLEF